LAKRVFEIAKELGIKSKAIVEKCEAEGVPNVSNHMSSVSAGLEATIHEWFSEASESAGGTAVETTTHVDLKSIRAKPRARARAKARAKPKPAEPEAPPQEPPATKAPTEPAEPAAPSEPEAPKQEPLAPAAKAPEEPGEGPPAETGPAHTGGAPAEPEQPAQAGAEPVMNVPNRPRVIKPAGPQLDAKKPAALSGPKVVRVEAPEQIEQRRARPAGPPRGPRVGAGVGAPVPPPGEEEAGRGARRNKRRTGASRTSRRSPRSVEETPEKKRWREQDLLERQAKLSRAGGFLRQRRRDMKMKQRSTGERASTAAETGGAVKLAAPFTIKDLSAATGVRSSDIIKKLFMQGEMATVNSGIEPEKAQELMLEYDIELDIEAAKSAEEAVREEFAERDVVNEQPRHPIVTILGHVDHGKTSLLDRIREAKVAEGEAGGITQATSAFRVPVHIGDESKQVVFLDTPGHEAFTGMRARGAQVTDIVVLVVAADDGVMPQTVESIDHAKAAGVPIIVALNKMDKPEATDANIQKILGQLAEHGLNPVEWGGETEVVRTSAASGDGVTEVLETIDFRAQLLELTADYGGPARGTVIESALIEGRGPTANVLIQDGELNVGDFIVAGRAFGRVRDITDDTGRRIKSASPATPVQISGLDELPDAGDKCYIVSTLKQAQEAAEQRRHREREAQLAQPKVTLESMLSQMKDAETKELLVVIKADVQGSVDVLRKSAEEVQGENVRVRVLHAAVGGITESDVILAEASGAVIIGFNVIPSAKARRLAEDKGVEIRSYQVIYNVVDDLRQAAAGLLAPEIRQEVLGHAEVRKVFRVSKVGAVAGCYVTDGVIERNAYVRVTRDDIVIENDRVLEQLKRFKDDVKEVRAGQECGMKIEGYDDIKEGDILECYRRVEVRREL